MSTRPAAAELGTGPSRWLSPGCCPPPLLTSLFFPNSCQVQAPTPATIGHYRWLVSLRAFLRLGWGLD